MSSSPESSAPDHKSVRDQSASMDSASESLSLSPKSSSPDPKRLKRVGQFDLGNNKVCIVLRHSVLDLLHTWADKPTEYMIFVIDLNAVPAVADAADIDVHTLNPTIVIDCGLYDSCAKDAFCVLGKTLYMFEGNSGKEGYTSKKSVFSFYLSHVSHVELMPILYKKSSLEKICDMHTPKPCPMAIPTPDGSKIVIFPTGGNFGHDCDLFYPTEKEPSCQLLPKIGLPSYDCIQLFGFISNSKLMIDTSTGFYLLDLDLPKKQWDHQNSVLGGVTHLFAAQGTSPFVTVEDRFCLATTGGAFDLYDFVGEIDERNYIGLGFADRSPVLRQLYRDPRCSLEPYFAFMDHDNENERFNFCQLVMDNHFLLISVCYIDLKKYKERTEQTERHFGRDEARSIKEACTVVVKRLKLALNMGYGTNLEQPYLISCVCV